ncbi:unnamed protein product [Dimorphilus gyrociliatus]|uniref:Uncharacterized protein n=1 Tax=Dimorphilus gyrociliatus TaxID=2664684 RepID=A0A7I8VGZ1_9ANNE|nr:unnamed protein product [Dimorphilus gyrociliatus]
MNSNNTATGYTPRPFSRCGSEAAYENMNRNRGTMGLIMDSECNKNYSDPEAPKPRILSDAAQEYATRNKGSVNLSLDSARSYVEEPKLTTRVRPEGSEYALKNVKGSIDGIFKAKDPYTTPRLASRTSGDGRNIAEKSQGQMNLVLDQSANRKFRNDFPAARVKPEASGNAAKNAGVMHLCLDETKKYSYDYAQPRVKPEASEIASKSRGSMDQVFSSRPCPVETKPPRVRPEATEYAQKNAGSTKELFESYGKLSDDKGTRNARVRGEGQDIAKSGNKGTLHILIEKHGQLPGDSKPPRRLKGSGSRYANRSKGQGMNVMLHGEKKTYKHRSVNV